MADIRIVYGPAGSGKTYKAVRDFYKASLGGDPLFPERNSFLIVPEQMTVETEKKFFETVSEEGSHGRNGLIGSEVISFGRLVHRILSESDVKIKRPMTGTMRSMILLKVLNELDSLTVFESVSERPSAVARLSNTVSELEKYCVTTEILKEAARKYGEANPDDLLTPQRLSELSIILEKYEEASKDYSELSKLIPLAAKQIGEGTSCVENSDLFFDGFSGFTDEEMILISAMAGRAKSVTFYVFKDSDNPVFSIPNRTYLNLVKMFPGCKTLPIDCKDHRNTRFSDSADLYRLSREYAYPLRSRNSFTSDSVEIVSAVDFYHEIEACAKRINELVAGGDYTYSDIAVAMPSVKDNYHIFNAIFKDHGIPCFIDAHLEYSGHRIIRLVDSFLKILAGERVIDNIRILLKTGLIRRGDFSRDDIDVLDNELLKYGCVRAQTFDAFERFIEKSKKRLNPGADDPFDYPPYIKMAEDLLRLFSDKENGYRHRNGNYCTVNDLLDMVSDFILKNVSSSDDHGALWNESGNRDDRDYIRVRSAFIDIMNECSEVLGNVKGGKNRIALLTDDVLMSAAASIKAASIPFSGAFVQIGDIERSGYMDKKVMMVLGANMGSFPGDLPDSSFLGDNERDAISSANGKTAYNSVDRVLLSQFNVYRILTCARKLLYLSYSMSSGDGDECIPATAVGTVKSLFGGLKETIYAPSHSETVKNIDIIRGRAEVDSENVKRAMNIGDEFSLGATTLDAIDKCDVRFFYETCLGLRPRDTGELNSNTMGTYVHALLEGSIRNAYADINSSKRPESDLDKVPVWREYVEQADNEFRSSEYNANALRYIENSSRNSEMALLTKDAVALELKNMKEISGKTQTGFPISFELRFGDKYRIPSVKFRAEDIDVRISGSIDRVDAKIIGEKVILTVTDYKSYFIKTTNIENGEKLQLPIYALALESKEAKDAVRSALKDRFVQDDKIEVDKIRYYCYGDQLEPESTGQKHAFSELSLSDNPGIIKDEGGVESKVSLGVKSKISRMINGHYCAPEKPDCSNCRVRSICKISNGDDD